MCRPLAFSQIPRPAWDRLLAVTADATPFARWTVHHAWWDAYGSTAHDDYLVCLRGGAADSGGTPDGRDIVAIVPLMHRHELEPDDERTATILRRHTDAGTRVRPDAKAVFFGASYHADYATILCSPDDLPAVARAVVEHLAGPLNPSHGDQEWDAVDLRRLRQQDPTLTTLEAAFRDEAVRRGWQVLREREDVCPVVTIAGSWDDYLAGLGKKARHEIRRKMRRADAAGGLTLRLPDRDTEAVDRFIELHQARFGEDGLFRPGEGGDRSRRFIHALAELESGEPDGGQLQLPQVYCGDRLLFAAVSFDDGRSTYLYNAGMDPSASDLSPGITGTAAYLRDRIAAGRQRFDFLRGDEPYKYEWGARDEPIERLLVLREAVA